MSLLFCEVRNDILRFQKWDMQPTDHEFMFARDTQVCPCPSLGD